MTEGVCSIGVYGGSFDPVHFGHLRSALEVQQQLGLDQLRFIPAGNPPHKAGPVVNAADRVKMLELAIADGKAAENTGLVVDRREIERQKPSYTFDTLEELQNELPQAQLTLIIGTDQFSVFDTWHRWRELLGIANLAVMERPGEILSEFAIELLQGELLQSEPASKITMCPVTQLDISSTRIRNELSAGTDIRFLLPYAVRRYIIEHQLYT